MEPLGELTAHGQGSWCRDRVVSDGPICAITIPAIGEAVVGASPPVGDALFPVRRQEGGITTGGAPQPGTGSLALRSDDRRSPDFVRSLWRPTGKPSWLIDRRSVSRYVDFVGSVRCAAPRQGTVHRHRVEMDAASASSRTLSVVPLDRTGGGNKQTLNFAHFVNGTWITDLVFVNLSSEASRPAPTPFHSLRAVPLFISTTPRATRLPPNRWWTSRAIWRSPRTAL